MHCAVAPPADPGDAQPAPFPGHPRARGERGLCGRRGRPRATRSPTPHSTPRTAPGRAREAHRGRRVPARRARAPAPPRRGLGAPPRAAVVGSHPALPPGARRGGGGHLPLPPAAPVPPLLAGWAGQDRTSVRAGGGTLWAEGDPGHQGDDGSASSLSEGQSCAPALGPLNPHAGSPDPRRRRNGDGEDQAASAAPTHPLRSGPAAPPQPQQPRSRRSQMLSERSPGTDRRLPEPPAGGGREPAQGSLGDVVQRPLHLHPRPLSIRRPLMVFPFPELLLFLSTAYLRLRLINVRAPHPSRVPPLLPLDQWFSRCGTQTSSFSIIWEPGRNSSS